MSADRLRLNKRCAYQLPTEAPRLLPVPDWGDLNPINLNYTLELQVFSIVGDGLQLREAASLYFRTVHTWFPVVSEERYYAQLASVRVKTDPTPSDFSLLTLCMALVCKEPIAGDVPGSARSLYVSIKSFVSILEAMGTNSLKIVQSRILLTIFEIGHAINPSAYISAAANVRAAMSLGLDSFTKDVGSQKYEEAQNVWRAVMIVDR
ncbi:hypothetical protein N7533_004710 [Penicillium manginii]|jgi:hypothetical protein|uniref:uncharacterized protein n=1 Tax=Penicillium manginii TaxID=203109 RepID=UPI002547978E|nr:uncharacterized protein N7533_004710 [Penicillium manginii]KAJ5755167.1 hypothetical protein N7533_004710 [Penicillium manginii]